MYNPGDAVLLSGGGVWLISAADQDTVELTDIRDGSVLTLSTDNTQIIRKAASKESLDAVIERIPYLRTIQAPNDKIRREFYEEAMAKYDEAEWVKVIKTVYLRGQEKRLATWETDFGDRARDYFHGEIAARFGIPFQGVEEYISSRVADDNW